MKQCTEPECQAPHKARGFCVKHYGQKLYSGELKAKKTAPRGAGIRESLEFVGWDVAGPLGCWEWKGGKSADGYGVMQKFAGTAAGALVHRLSYAAYVSPIPKRMPLHHRCSNKICMNPSHLEFITDAENVGEMLMRTYLESRIADLEQEILRLGGTVPL